MSEQLSGISNYCFRWCERCPFTQHCAVYEMGRQSGASPLHDYPIPRSFPALSGTYTEFLERLDRQLQNHGSSLEELQDQPVLSPVELRAHANTLAMEYIRGVSWAPSLLRSTDLSDHRIQAIHALNWYVMLMVPKIHRALREVDASIPGDDFQYSDARRTAYLILLCLARATAAATVLLEHSVEPRPKIIHLAGYFLRFADALRAFFPDVSLYPRPYWEAEPYLSRQQTFYEGQPPLHPFLEGVWTFGGERAPVDN